MWAEGSGGSSFLTLLMLQIMRVRATIDEKAPHDIYSRGVSSLFQSLLDWGT